MAAGILLEVKNTWIELICLFVMARQVDLLNNNTTVPDLGKFVRERQTGTRFVKHNLRYCCILRYVLDTI